MKKCANCGKKIQEKFGKLKGTLIKVKNEKGKKQRIYVCSDCEKQKNYIEKAIIREA